MAKKKFYGVAVGRVCGIFKDWATTEKQVKSFPGAKFKGFASEEAARRWLENPTFSKEENKEDGIDVVALQQKFPGEVVVYTDGGCRKNPGPGGYGVVIVEDGRLRELQGGFRLTTNNRMEVLAAIVALSELEECRSRIRLFSDSSYLVNAVNKGWINRWIRNGWRKKDGQPVANVDLWRKLSAILARIDVVFCWVKGHEGDEGNERCDRLATDAYRTQAVIPDKGFEETLASGQ